MYRSASTRKKVSELIFHFSLPYIQHLLFGVFKASDYDARPISLFSITTAVRLLYEKVIWAACSVVTTCTCTPFRYFEIYIYSSILLILFFFPILFYMTNNIGSGNAKISSMVFFKQILILFVFLFI